MKQKCMTLHVNIRTQSPWCVQVFGTETKRSSTWTYQLDKDVIHSVMGSDRHTASLNLRSSLNAMVLAV